MKLARIACVAVLLSVAVSAQSRDPIAGAWEMTAQKNLTTGEATTLPKPALRVIYADGYYVQFTAEADRKSSDKPTAELTKDELIDRLRMQGQNGTYRIQGGKLTRQTVIAAFPPNNGRANTLDFRIEGGSLITISTNAEGQKTETRFRKLK
jgi:hypothetical protein